LTEPNEVINVNVEGADGKGSRLVRVQRRGDTDRRWLGQIVGGRRVGNVFKPMRGSRGSTTASVGEVGGCFGSDAEEWGGFDPTHGKNKWDADELFFIGFPWKKHSKARGLIWREADPIKPVGNINFEEMYGTVRGVGVTDGSEDPVECTSELHGLGWRMRDGVGIDAIETEIHNEARAALTLGHDAQRGEPQGLELLHQTVGKDGPEPFFNEIREFLPHKGGMIGGGGVRPAVDAILQALGRPGRRGEFDRGPVCAKTIE
jgi:hypothetical protein